MMGMSFPRETKLNIGNSRKQLRGVLLLQCLDVALDLHGGRLDYKIHASIDTNCHVEQGEMVAKRLLKCMTMWLTTIRRALP